MKRSTPKQVVSARRMERSLVMEPTRTVVPEAYRYMKDLAKGQAIQNFFDPPKRKSVRVVSMSKEIEVLRRQVKERDFLISHLEDNLPIKRTTEVGPDGEIGYVVRSHPTEVDKRKKKALPTET